MQAIRNIWKLLVLHPLSKGMVPARLIRFVRWQLATRVFPASYLVPFVNDARLVVRRGMTGATGNVYVGLMEYEDMSFALHFLRPREVFADVGANVGVYTVLASKVCGARALSFEPVAESVSALRDNIRVNQIDDLVRVEAVAVGEKSGHVLFTNDQDTTNHIVSHSDPLNDSVIEVDLRSLDDLIPAEDAPTLIKIDVEGYEWAVIQGANRVLSDPRCRAVIIEINGSGKRYGLDDNTIDERLRSFGFRAASYDPQTRHLRALDTYGTHNTIYVKDFDFAGERLATAPAFRVLGMSI